ncbi:MAG: TolC family protein [Nibricoccus sp.]
MKQMFLKSALFALTAIVPAIVMAAPEPDREVPPRLDLPGAIQFAIENNFDIRQARERIRQQEGLLVEIRSRSIPNADVSYYYTKFDKNRLEPVQRITDQDWAVEFSVTQTLFAGGSVYSSIGAQKLRREAALLELRSVISNVLLGVRAQFNAVLLAKKKISVAEQSLNLLEEQLKTVRDRYEAGTLSKFDLLRAEVAVANGKPLLIRSRNAYRIAIEELRQTLGFTTLTPGTVTKVPEFLGELTYEPTNIELQAALESARANRPELQQLYKLEQAAEKSVTAAKGNYYPNLGVGAGYIVKKSSASDDLGKTREGWNAIVQGSWAIFDGRATAGRVAQARSALAQTKLSAAESQLAVDVEVRRAHSALQEASELVTASKAVVEQAAESVRLSKARFAAGTATQLDVLQAQVALTDASTNEVEALYNHTVALASLRKAMGVADAFAPTQTP